MKNRKIIAAALSVLILTALFSITASADFGPKPSVRIELCGIGDEVCYATLLSKTESTGPSSAWNGDEEYANHKGISEYYPLEYEIWLAFVEYEDSDGYYFLQEGWLVDDDTPLAWTYYPPSSFKLLLYFPERGAFVSSGIYERYAFDSYFSLDISGIDLGSAGGEATLVAEQLVAERSYDYTMETVSLIARIIGTIAVELIVALVFGFAHKAQLWLLTGVNVVTQIGLNVILNIVNYQRGYLAFLFTYIELEILVFIAEAVLYCLLINKVSDRKRGKFATVLYALVANAASFAAGLGLAHLIPGIF